MGRNRRAKLMSVSTLARRRRAMTSDRARTVRAVGHQAEEMH